MLEKSHRYKSFGLIILGFLLSGCFASFGKKADIPVMTRGALATSNKYFDVVAEYKDSGVTPIYSISGLTKGLANKAAAEGASAFVQIKTYEKYTRAAISGIHAYVEGVGIKWKPADDKTLLADLVSLTAKQQAFSPIQQSQLLMLIQRQKMQSAIPQLRQAMMKPPRNQVLVKQLAHTYINIIDGSEAPHLVSMVDHPNDQVRGSAILSLTLHGTSKHAPLFLGIIKKNERAYAHSAAKAFKRVASSTYLAEWKKLFKHHADPNVRLIAAEVLLAQNQRKLVEQEARQVDDSSFKLSLNKMLLQ